MADAHLMLGSGRTLQVAVPRLVGVAALIMCVRLLPGFPLTYPSFGTWVVFASLWLVGVTLLLLVRRVRVAGALLAILSLAWVVWPTTNVPYGLLLLAWFGAILAITEGRPRERALLIRTLVTTVYAFAALSKLNPSFLAGDQLVEIANTRDHMEAFMPLLASTVGILLSWSAVAGEAWLAIGLWFERTRRQTVALGVSAHIFFWWSATSWLWGGANLAVLNGLLIVGYLAFFHPVSVPTAPTGAHRVATSQTSGSSSPAPVARQDSTEFASEGAPERRGSS